MKFGKVIGSVTATIKDPGLQALKFHVVQALDEKLRPLPSTYIAADAVGQVGLDDIVTVVFSRDAAEAFLTITPPVDASIVGIVAQTV
ncbi:MAG: EutN/CcmL family microcompartment protein [Firmicutes bacterium]|nr:EutN/CcmL family microcompartment protein [Bacillota bacterium]